MVSKISKAIPQSLIKTSYLGRKGGEIKHVSKVIEVLGNESQLTTAFTYTNRGKIPTKKEITEILTGNQVDLYV